MRRYLSLAILFLSLCVNSALAQTETDTAVTQTNATPVTASLTASGVRLVAPAEVAQMRLELYAANGERVFDSGQRPGNVLDWQPADVPQGLADGQYLCVVTVKDLQGQVRQRLLVVSLQAGQVSLQKLAEQELSAAQTQALAASRQARAVAPADNDNAVTILREGKTRAVTIAAHDGETGQLTSTRGPLTFRTGDLFAGREREQMRITPDGRVGIGTDKPETMLDVAGEVRARGGIRLPDGTLLTSAENLAGHALIAPPPGVASVAVAGTGTPDRLTKWADSTGTLADSAVTESGGNVGIGTNNPLGRLHLVDTVGSAATGDNTFRIESTAGTVGPSFRFKSAEGADYLMTATGSGNAGGAGAFRIFDFKAVATRFFIAPTGNIGLGTVTPTQKLEVAGSLKLSGAGSALIFPDGSSMTTAGAGGGSSPSGTSIVTALNDPTTTGTINDNRLSPNVARLNGTNAWSGANVFNFGLSANGAPITNVGNPTTAGDAVNKAFFDTNAIRLTPGAAQVSVGDANGTAVMLNLRGGSTCCGGPGGFTPADFKVFQNGSFVATGNLGIGVSPLEGKGYRTSWYTYKGAFRSGYADNEWDDANTGFFSWAGGSNSTASGLYSFAFGDTNFASSTSSIVFGSGNEVKGAAGFSAGAGNRVCDTYGVAFGNKAFSGGPLINGRCDPDSFNITGLAAVAIGFNVTADKDHTMAFGKFASNNGFAGTFIWSDGSATASADTFRNTANNEFAARATGGFRFRTNLTGTTGCNLPAGSGVFNCTSSRYTKENFLLTSGEDVLTRLRKIPVSTWNYISEGRQVRHMGPMAEDFYQVFALGTGNTSIGVQDLAGVSLAAVKALDERTTQLQQRTAELTQLRTEVDALRAANTALEQRLAALEQNMPQRTRTTTQRRRH
jgi:hypothetical protein